MNEAINLKIASGISEKKVRLDAAKYKIEVPRECKRLILVADKSYTAEIEITGSLEEMIISGVHVVINKEISCKKLTLKSANLTILAALNNLEEISAISSTIYYGNAEVPFKVSKMYGMSTNFRIVNSDLEVEEFTIRNGSRIFLAADSKRKGLVYIKIDGLSKDMSSHLVVPDESRKRFLLRVANI